MITTFSVSNFKAFQSQTLELAPLTILTGLNGSGKSSLMHALLLLRQAYESGSLHRGTVPLNGDYVRLGTPVDVRNESSSEDNVKFELTLLGYSTLNISLSFAGESDRIALATFNEFPNEDDGLFGADFIFLAADRVSPQVYYDVPNGLSANGRLGIHGERTAHYLSQFGSRPMELTQLAHEGARSTQLSHQVEAWMGEISPGVQIHSDSESSLDIVSLSYSFISRRDVSRRYRATNVGFGVTYALPVVTALLSARPRN